MIIAIDPGSEESGYVILDEDLRPQEFGKIPNDELLGVIEAVDANNQTYSKGKVHMAIEMVACYGMPVGKEIFDTCVWIGRFWEAACSMKKTKIYRKDEKINLCQSMKANDANITQALVDRFAPGQKNHGKGTKKDPSYFYGFSKDVWQAYAVGITYADLYINNK